MAFYEHTIVGKQDLSEKEVENLISKYSKIIDKSGKILKTEKWGLLNLANKIKKIRKVFLSILKWKVRVRLSEKLKNYFQLMLMSLDISL